MKVLKHITKKVSPCLDVSTCVILALITALNKR